MVIVWSGRAEFWWLFRMGIGGWWSRVRRVTVAGWVVVVFKTFAICLELSNGNTCS
jgi:hypothetical protein